GDVLADRTDRSVVAAITALRRADQPPWGPTLGEALAATAQIAEATRRYAAPGSLWSLTIERPAPHASGLPAGTAGSCGTCAWRHVQRGVSRCRQAEAKVEDAWPGCERFEPALDCQTCGACCRAAYHIVEVKRRDPCVTARPDFIVDRGG